MDNILELNHREIWKTPKALQFCESRGIGLSAIKKFQLGYETRKTTRLVNRLLFPMRNITGEFLGFQGRALDNKTLPKYWHQKFDKQRFLYGLYENLELIQELGFVVLLEGNIDVITLWQCGIPSVAKQGGAFSPLQASLVRRYTDTIVDWEDSDDAGKKAVENAKEVIEAFEFKRYRVQSNKFKDANELYLAKGANAVRKMIYD